MSNVILEVLRKEMLRCANMLPTLDPTTQEYSVALHNYETLSWKVSVLENPSSDPDFLPAPKPVTDVPSVTEEPKVEAPEEPKAENKPNMDEFRLSLRERLADARLKGVNTAELLITIGVAKFSAVPDEKLPELSDLLESKLKELT